MHMSVCYGVLFQASVLVAHLTVPWFVPWSGAVVWRRGGGLVHLL